MKLYFCRVEKLTALIPTGNEAHNIEAVLKSVAFADEVLVVDSFSTDDTLKLAEPLADRIIQREYEHSASQKNWAIPQAKHEWILLVDADERVSEELAKEIQEILKNPGQEVAYWIYRDNHFMGKRLKYSGWQNDKVIRLFRKSKCRYENKHVHAEVIADGKVGFLKNHLDHNTYLSLDHYLNKINRYANLQAKDYDKKTGKITAYHLVFKPFSRFLKHYILQLGFLDGVPGFTVSTMQAFAVRTRYIKLWILRMERNKA